MTLGSSSRHGTPAGSLAMVHDPPGSWEGEREAQKEARVGQFRLCAPPHNTRLCLLISGRSEIMVSAAGVRESLSGTRLCRARRPNRKGDRHRHRRTMPNDFLLASTSTADRSSRTWTGSRSALPISRRGPDCPPPRETWHACPHGEGGCEWHCAWGCLFPLGGPPPLPLAAVSFRGKGGGPSICRGGWHQSSKQVLGFGCLARPPPSLALARDAISEWEGRKL